MEKKVKKVAETIRQNIKNLKNGKIKVVGSKKARNNRIKTLESIIQDTSAPPLILDTSNNAPVTLEVMLNEQREKNENTNITFRIKKWKVNTLKKIALEESIKSNTTVLYTDLINRAIDKHFFQKKK